MDKRHLRNTIWNFFSGDARMCYRFSMLFIALALVSFGVQIALSSQVPGEIPLSSKVAVVIGIAFTIAAGVFMLGAGLLSYTGRVTDSEPRPLEGRERPGAHYSPTNPILNFSIRDITKMGWVSIFLLLVIAAQHTWWSHRVAKLEIARAQLFSVVRSLAKPYYTKAQVVRAAARTLSDKKEPFEYGSSVVVGELVLSFDRRSGRVNFIFSNPGDLEKKYGVKQRQ